MGIANSHSIILFGWYMVVFRYGWKGIYFICVGLFTLRNHSYAGFHVHKEEALKAVLL